jgi:predicted NBD/HSP70 family sugar kinase
MPLPLSVSPVAASVGNSNDQSRRHNLSAILSMLHRDGPQSRATLTRNSGLNRSTIAALVMELGTLGLVFETEAADSGSVGRPSPVVHPNSRVAVIAVNPDVDAVMVGIVGLGGVLHRRIRFPTTAVPTVQDTVDIVAGIIAGLRPELDSDFRIIGVGVAVPGLVASSSSRVILAPHLGWRNVVLAETMASALSYPVHVANDASLGAIAESTFGAGRAVKNLVYLNGSPSGIGGGVIAGGALIRGSRGFAGELGHTLVNSQGIQCHCGKTGCLETEVNLESLLSAIGSEGIDLDQLDLVLDATEGVPEVRAEIDRQLDVLGTAIGSFISVFDPEAFVLGGFLASIYRTNPQRLLDRVQVASFGELGVDIRIEPAQLGSRVLMIGAAELALADTLANPAALGATAAGGE